MEKRNYLKIVWLAGFIAFASVSCWATASSLHMLLPTLHIVWCWIVSIGFFIIASWGTKMIVDSLNQNVYLDKRGLRLIGGLFILFVFWLVCSMPTNTHTFFYRAAINDKVSSDVATTQGYLGQVENNTNNKRQAELKVNKLKNDVDITLGELEAEIKNEAQPGFGPKSKEILRKFATLLGVDKIDELSYKGTSKQDREKLIDAYRTKIYALAENRAENLKAHIQKPNADDIKEAKAINENLSIMKKAIAEGDIDLNDPMDVTGTDGVCDKINDGYNAIKKNQDFVNFSSEADKTKYTADNPICNVKRMVSVFDVWNDFLAGEYAGYGFVFWIIISILVDIAAFIFFDLAFRKTED